MAAPDAGVHSFAALATSEAFVERLVQDVHVLADSFVLMWLWLDKQTPAVAGASRAPPPDASLRWEYGALVVFERVWVKNGWNRAADTLGSCKMTRRAFCRVVADAFLDKLAVAEGADATTADGVHATLQAVAGLFGLYLWWTSQPEGVWDAIDVDESACTVRHANLAALRCLAQLPEHSRAVLDCCRPVDGKPPPSADVWYVASRLMGTAQHAGIVRVVLEPTRTPRLRAETRLMPRRDVEAGAPHEAAATPDGVTVRRQIMESLGVPSETTDHAAPSIGLRTAHALDELSNVQGQYMQSRGQMHNPKSWSVPSLWDSDGADALERSVAQFSSYLQNAG